VGAALAALSLVASPSAGAALPSVGSGARPGPDALYAPAPAAPQLENAAPWAAPPILVSGAAAYRQGEFLYQDFLHDDRGARGIPDPGDPHGPGDFLFSPKAGTLTYPAGAAFAHNAADLVELRVKPLAGATAFRVTLNTLIDPERTAFTIAIGGDEETLRDWPHGAGVRSPARLFLTVHGQAAELRDAASGAPLGPAPSASVDLRRRQIDVRVPHAAWNPGREVVRLAAGTGLWDPAAGRYLQPGTFATSERPGGAAPSGAALVNVAFRFDEPQPDVTQFGAGVTIGDAAVGGMVDAAWWRERAQADTLLVGDVTRFHADVDFGRLQDRAGDESRVPRTGSINRILASRHSSGQGVDHREVCFDLASASAAGPRCKGRLVGQLQPYALYVPDRPAPAAGWGMTLLLHSLSANHNQYATSRNQSQLGERGAGSLVATPAGRGPDGFYAGIAEADTFEVWADVARHYPLDPSWASVSGYSMGGFGTFRLLARWPDLFARGMSTVGVPGSVADQLASLRNTPLMSWAAAADELVNLADTEESVRLLTEAGVRFRHDLFPAADHLTLATADEYGPAAEFLGEHRVDRDPAHVTYVVDPSEDSAAAQAVADHAYWLSALRVRGDGRGTIDARSEAFGTADAPVLEVERSAGAVQGGARGPQPYVRRERRWGDAPAAPRADRLVVRTTGIAAATVDARRARLSCAPTLDVRADGPLDLRIACPPVTRPRRCAPVLRLAVPRVRGRRVVAVRITRNRRVVRQVRGRDLRRVSVRRSSRRAFSLRLRVTTNRAGGRARIVTVVRRYRACGA